jgi:hypothetical protein
MKQLLLNVCFVALAACQVAPPIVRLGPYSAASNLSTDLLGAVDSRPSTWGTAGVQSWKITFKPPVGYRVRVLEIDGDLVAWPRIVPPGDQPVAAGLVSGILLSFQTTAPQGSTRCDLCADNTMLYVQDAVGGMPEKTRAPFARSVKHNGLLQPDNVLVVVVANWLNVTGKYIHIEPTFNIVFQFEKENLREPQK